MAQEEHDVSRPILRSLIKLQQRISARSIPGFSRVWPDRGFGEEVAGANVDSLVRRSERIAVRTGLVVTRHTIKNVGFTSSSTRPGGRAQRDHRRGSESQVLDVFCEAIRTAELEGPFPDLH